MHLRWESRMLSHCDFRNTYPSRIGTFIYVDAKRILLRINENDDFEIDEENDMTYETSWRFVCFSRIVLFMFEEVGLGISDSRIEYLFAARLM